MKLDTKKTPQQAQFLKRLAGAKNRLLDAITGLDEEAICSEPIVEDWTVKDILGHVVSWNEEFRADIEMILQGKHPGYERQISGDDDFDEWNQREIARKRRWTWQRVRDDFDRDYREAVQLIERLEPRDFRKRGVTPWKRAAMDRPAVLATTDTESIQTLVTYHWRHINEHAIMIERWRKRRGRT